MYAILDERMKYFITHVITVHLFCYHFPVYKFKLIFVSRFILLFKSSEIVELVPLSSHVPH